MTQSTAVRHTHAGDTSPRSLTHMGTVRDVGPNGRSHRTLDIARLELQLNEALAALAANRAFPRLLDADLRIHDQARILRLLFICGPQAAIETTTPWQHGGEVGPRFATTVGRDAGCRELWSVDAAIEELCAAGLIRFRRKPLRDGRRYDLLEDEADAARTLLVSAAQETLRGALCLTRLGESLCRRHSMSCGSAPISRRTSGRFSKAASREPASPGAALIGPPPKTLL